MKKIIILGSGFSSLSAACYMAKQGHQVTVLEKNSQLGGRARWYEKQGFVIDMGPSFYWMPGIVDAFFQDFGHKTSDFFELTRLDPGYVIYFGEQDYFKVSANLDQIMEDFESLEPHAGEKLKSYLERARYNYEVALQEVIEQPGDSLLELITARTIGRVGEFITSHRFAVEHQFKHKKLQQVLEFPVLFLGAKPSQTPSFYKFMNYVDLEIGTWHIQGGMHKLVEAMVKLGESMGVTYKTHAEITKIVTHEDKAVAVEVNGEQIWLDVLLSGADYHHTETLLEPHYRNYKERFWDKEVMAPSALMYYVGFDRPIEHIWHHTLFFDTSFEEHADSIYTRPRWPKVPLFYTSFPAKSDPSIAPVGKDLAIILIPIAAGIKDSPSLREHYFEQIMDRMEHLTHQSIKSHILFQDSYCLSDFCEDYYAYKGNAYGLANTLFQTAYFKPKMRNKHLSNLFYMGQLTVPGPGIPPTIISGRIASRLAEHYLISQL